MRWLVIGFSAICYFEYIFFFWLYYYFGEVRKISAADTAFYTSMPFLAWVVMMPLGGWLADLSIERFGARSGMKWIAIGTMLCSVACLMGALMANDTRTLVALLSLAFGFCSVADIVYWSAVISIFDSQAGTAGGLMNTGGNVGGGIAPVLTPVIASHYGWSAGIAFGGLIALIGLLAWLFIDPSRTPLISKVEAEART
jgi:ACS family glucarate transporter-like MFS transporter